MKKDEPDLGSAEWLQTSGLGSWIESRVSMTDYPKVLSHASASLVATLRGVARISESLTARLHALLDKPVTHQEFALLAMLFRENLNDGRELLNHLSTAQLTPESEPVSEPPKVSTPEETGVPEGHTERGEFCAWCDQEMRPVDSVIQRDHNYYHLECVREAEEVKKILDKHYPVPTGGWHG